MVCLCISTHICPEKLSSQLESIPKLRYRNFQPHLLLTEKIKGEGNFPGFLIPSGVSQPWGTQSLYKIEEKKSVSLVVQDRWESSVYKTQQQNIFQIASPKFDSFWKKSLQFFNESDPFQCNVLTLDFCEAPHDFKLVFNFSFISKKQYGLKLQFEEAASFFNF